MIDIKRIAGCVTNKHLGLILMPTEKCNFRCTYCYEDFAIGKMPLDVINGVKNFLSRRIKEISSLHIDWFGGEPLAAKQIIYDLGGHIKKLLNENPEVSFRSGMTTNGFLLKENTLNKLLNLGINSFQISLDGPKDIHNKTRLRIDGSGSFEGIWSNLLAMKQTDYSFEVVLRIHVTPENYHAIPDLIETIKAEFGEDKRFRVFFKAIANLGGSNGGSFATLGKTERNQLIEKFYAQLNGKTEPARLNKFKNSEPYICYASKPNNLTIRANGVISKCTVAFDDDRNNLGRINSDGTLQISNDKLNIWVRGLTSKDESTLHCPMHNMPELKTKKINIPVVVE